MLSRPGGMPSRNDRPPSIWNTHGISGNVLQIQWRLLQHLIRKSPILGFLMCQNIHHRMWWVKAKHQTPNTVQDQRCQSGPSARNSFVPSEGRFSKNYGADQQRLQISDPHFDKFSTSATFACLKIRFKTEVWLVHNFLRKLCCGSKKWSWLIKWMISNLRVL